MHSASMPRIGSPWVEDRQTRNETAPSPSFAILPHASEKMARIGGPGQHSPSPCSPARNFGTWIEPWLSELKWECRSNEFSVTHPPRPVERGLLRLWLPGVCRTFYDGRRVGAEKLAAFDEDSA